MPSRSMILRRMFIVALASSMILITWILQRQWKSTVHYPNTLISSSAADRLPLNGSLFCYVLTSPKYHKTRVPAINETWLSRCDHGQFFSVAPIDDDSIPFTTAFAGLDDSYEALFAKTRAALKFAYRNIFDQFDWYLKADDDTYVIVEHLKDYLKNLDPKLPYYLGYNFKPFLKNGYNSGGSGYVLSNAAIRIFVEKLADDSVLCPDDLNEDVGLGRCLANAEIFPYDTRNHNGQHRFFYDNIITHFTLERDDAFYIKWPVKRRYAAFAPDAISFHKLTPNEIRLYDILLYRIGRRRVVP